jgi:UDP-apiose/xylose synthase
MSNDSSSPQRIAVLGAGGFLGSHLVTALLARPGWQVDAVDLNLAKLPADLPGARLRRIEADIRPGLHQAGLLEELVDECDVVMSLTALCNPALYNTRPLEVIDASYTDLVPLVKLCTARRRWLVHFSTCEVYGRAALSAMGAPTAEMSEDGSALWTGPIHRERWTYACAKQLLERVIYASGHHHGLPFTIVRPFNVIGPRMDFVPGIDGEGVPRVLANFMGALMAGQDLLLVDGGRRRRSFIYVDDFIAGVLRILDRPAACQGEIFNLGNPANEISIADLATAMAAAYHAHTGAAPARRRSVTAEELYGPGYDDCDERLPDMTKARQRLGFDPRTSLAEMLPPVITDYLDRYAARVTAALDPAAARPEIVTSSAK